MRSASVVKMRRKTGKRTEINKFAEKWEWRPNRIEMTLICLCGQLSSECQTSNLRVDMNLGIVPSRRLRCTVTNDKAVARANAAGIGPSKAEARSDLPMSSKKSPLRRPHPTAPSPRLNANHHTLALNFGNPNQGA